MTKNRSQTPWRAVAALVLQLAVCEMVLAREQATPSADLCSVKTVFIVGNGHSAKWYRKNLEKKTWLRIENVKSKADGILETWGSGSVANPSNLRLSRREPEEFLWEESERGNFLFKNPLDRLLKKLNGAAECEW